MADIDINSLEPNSYKYKAEKAKREAAQKSREKVSPVVDRDSVISTQKPLSKKFLETFLTEDIRDVKTWLLMDVLIPGIKNTFLDVLSMMFFGEVNSRNRGNGSRIDRNEYTNYRSYYRSNSNRRRDRDDYYDSDNKVDFRNIILRNVKDAERIINAMRNRIRDTGSVSVAELLDLIDATVPGRYTDSNYGWDDERDIGIRKVSSGFLIDVSEPKYLY